MEMSNQIFQMAYAIVIAFWVVYSVFRISYLKGKVRRTKEQLESEQRCTKTFEVEAREQRQHVSAIHGDKMEIVHALNRAGYELKEVPMYKYKVVKSNGK